MSQVWLITDCSRGLGRALAEAVLAAGHRLVATARNPAALAGLVERHSGRVRPVALDVTDPQAAVAAVRTAADAFGRLDVLVNNADRRDVGSIEDTSLEVFRAQLETTLFGVVNVTKAAIPLLREQRAGHVIQLSSIEGRVGSAGLGAYQAAVWGVAGFLEALDCELGPLGVKVTIVEPGGVRDDWAGSPAAVRPSRPEYDGTVGEWVRHARGGVGGRIGDPAKVATAVLRVAGVTEPPLRLLLGSDAVYRAERHDLARLAADRRWRHLSVSTDLDPAEPAGHPLMWTGLDRRAQLRMTPASPRLGKTCRCPAPASEPTQGAQR